ncbi:hypothetical protein BMS3Bbin02_02191 [bacterium BMS3Bbin02]|nr:hypothetical protein BMS3Bbin02_02191 [bacterium BMS3Bbin02]
MTRQPGRKAGVLPFLSDSERQLVVRDDDDGRGLFLVDPNLFDPSRTQRLGDECGQVFAPFNDVNLFAPQLIHDLTDSRTAGTDTRADRVDVWIIRCNGDLGSVSGLAGNHLDFNITVDKFRHLELKQ